MSAFTRGKNKGLAGGITSSEACPGIRLMTAPTGLRDGVFIVGSIPAGSMTDGFHHDATAALTLRMLEESTKKRRKKEFHETLEGLGAALDFSLDSHRVHFSLRALRRDIPYVIELLGEALRTPAFRSDEFEFGKKHMVAEIEQTAEYTDVQAETLFRQILYPASHPNYHSSTRNAVARMKKVSREDVKKFHASKYGRGDILIGAAGDVNHDEIADALRHAFGDWHAISHPAVAVPLELSVHARDEFITMRDKTSVDLLVGGHTGIARTHPDFLALSLGLSVLGHTGGFLGRLMREIREKQGLTYGVYAKTGGCSYGVSGHWFVWGTFAPGSLALGREAVRREIVAWHKSGISSAELALFKEAIIGSYRVGLSSARSVAGITLSNAEEGYPISYLDEYLEEVDRLSRESVNAAIAKHVNPATLISVAAGAIDGAGDPL